MGINFIFDGIDERPAHTACIYREVVRDYAWLRGRTQALQAALAARQVGSGTVAVLDATFTPEAVALLLAVIAQGGIAVPLLPAHPSYDALVDLAQAEAVVRLDAGGQVQVARRGAGAQHPLYAQLRRQQHPGLVLFSSGTTGFHKAAVHDLTRLLSKFNVRGKDLRTLAFFELDHIAGLDTLFYLLANGSTFCIATDRSPDGVCAAIERHRLEVLPTSPTFLNLLLLSEAYQRYDLSSLHTITYGAEVMPAVTLQRCRAAFPHARLLQRYGTTEFGALRTRSHDPASRWMQLHDPAVQIRVVDGLLEVRSPTMMLGYLNAPSPFTEDGWCRTGDQVAVDDKALHVLGRQSDIINVGGEKVFPFEVENTILKVDNVDGVVVYGEDHGIMGQIVRADILAAPSADTKMLKIIVQAYCRSRLAPFKVPVKIRFVEEMPLTPRFKKSTPPRATP